MLIKKIKKIIFLSLFTLLTIFTFSCKKSNSHTVKYTIQGTAKSAVTYVDGNGNTQNVTGADASWTTSFASTEHGLALKLTVISIDGGNIGGKMFIDGNQTAASNGNSGSVSITATLP